MENHKNVLKRKTVPGKELLPHRGWGWGGGNQKEQIFVPPPNRIDFYRILLFIYMILLFVYLVYIFSKRKRNEYVSFLSQRTARYRQVLPGTRATGVVDFRAIPTII